MKQLDSFNLKLKNNGLAQFFALFFIMIRANTRDGHAFDFIFARSIKHHWLPIRSRQYRVHIRVIAMTVTNGNNVRLDLRQTQTNAIVVRIRHNGNQIIADFFFDFETGMAEPSDVHNKVGKRLRELRELFAEGRIRLWRERLENKTSKRCSQ